MATLTSVSVTPIEPFVLINQTQQFIAVAHFSDAPDLDITEDLTTLWASSSTSVATVSNVGGSKGLATAQTISGSTTISATYGGQTGTAVLRVGLTNYIRIYEPTVEEVKSTENISTAAHNPIAKLTTPNFSMFSGGVSLQNFTGSSGGPIGWTVASGHPGDFTKTYLTNEPQIEGYWVQLNADGYATSTFSGSQRNLGVVTSIAVDSDGNELVTGGYPILVQISGEAYVYTNDPTIVLGSFLWYDVNGAIKATTFDSTNPTPIIGYALENYSDSLFPNKVLIRIQICGG